jgi:hypothetical protein
MAYKVTIQYTPFELVYGTQPIMPVEFVIPTKRVHNAPQEKLNKVIRVRMEDLFKLEHVKQHTKILTQKHNLINWVNKKNKIRLINIG